MKNDNLQFWSRVAGIYTLIQEGSNRKLYRKLILCCRQDIKPQEKVLELACGSGQLSEPLSRHAYDYLATDFCPEMVTQTAKRCPGLQCKVMDATALDCQDNSLDTVLIANALHIMPDPDKALQEIRRVLKKGGKLIAPTFVYEGKVNHFRMKIMALAGFKTWSCWTSDQLKTIMEKHGFTVTRCEVIPADPLPECYLVAVKA